MQEGCPISTRIGYSNFLDRNQWINRNTKDEHTIKKFSQYTTEFKRI